uniref:Insulin-like growth factor binding protein 2a n=2 Tax=Poecilia latipinna TaxID=48699 RepID=A0A3B3TU27_9TELE
MVCNPNPKPNITFTSCRAWRLAPFLLKHTLNFIHFPLVYMLELDLHHFELSTSWPGKPCTSENACSPAKIQQNQVVFWHIYLLFEILFLAAKVNSKCAHVLMCWIKGEALELQPDLDVSEIPTVRKPSKDAAWLGPKESAVRQHRQEMKTKMKTNKVEEVRPTRPKQTQCQQELDQVLERISKMPFRDNRGPLEDLYALHIPNCDKRGQYNPKQCKMSLHGQRGECWCVDPHTGQRILSAPAVRGDPNCSQYLSELELPDATQI